MTRSEGGPSFPFAQSAGLRAVFGDSVSSGQQPLQSGAVAPSPP